MQSFNKTRQARKIAARQIDARQGVARQDLCCAFSRMVSPRIRERQRQWIESKAQYRGVTVGLAGPEIDATDLGVLMAIYAIAARHVDDRAPCAERGMTVADAAHVGHGNAADNLASLRVTTSISEVADMSGMNHRDSGARRRIRAALTRLMAYVVSGETAQAWGATHLIGAACDKGGAVTIDLDFRATLAVLGDGQWAAVPLARWRGCKTPLERVLLHRLAALTTGRPVDVFLDTIAQGCWATDPANGHDQRWRRQQVRDALAAGRCVPEGINVAIDENGKVAFTRASPSTVTKTVPRF